MSHRVLVTGAQGFLGRNAIPVLAEKFPSSTFYATGRTRPWESFRKFNNVIQVVGNLASPDFWDGLPDNITHIIHLAAYIPYQSGESEPAIIVNNNLLPISQLIEKARRLPSLKQVIYGSSLSIYGPHSTPIDECSPSRPNSLYGAAKLAGEVLIETLSSPTIAVCILRFSSIYGNGQYEGTVLPKMVQSALKNEKITVFNGGKRLQNFISAQDASMAIALAYEKGIAGTFNIGGATSVTMRELASDVSRAFTNSRAIIEDKKSPAEEPYGFDYRIDKAKSELGFSPAVLLEGLKQMKRDGDVRTNS